MERNGIGSIFDNWMEIKRETANTERDKLTKLNEQAFPSLLVSSQHERQTSRIFQAWASQDIETPQRFHAWKRSSCSL